MCRFFFQLYTVYLIFNIVHISTISLIHTFLQKCYLAATETLKTLKSVDSQYELNGMRNIWILKPSDLCCGTGISISHNFKDIMRRVESKPKDYFVVQKYIGLIKFLEGFFLILIWLNLTLWFLLFLLTCRKASTDERYEVWYSTVVSRHWHFPFDHMDLRVIILFSRSIEDLCIIYSKVLLAYFL